MTTADKPGPFDKAVDILQWAMNHETATHEQIESIRAVLAVLEAAAKVDPKNAHDYFFDRDYEQLHETERERWRKARCEVRSILSAIYAARSSEASRD